MRNTLLRLCVLLLLVGLAACTAKSSNSGNTSAGGGASEGQYEEVHYYYDFDDILIHKDLKYDIKDSTVLEADSFKVGFQVFSGRIEPLSLVNFFIENMSKDGWKNVYSLKGKNSELIFEKPGKRCTIKVRDEAFNTKVEIQAVVIKGTPETTARSGAQQSPRSAPSSSGSGVKTSGGSAGGVQDRTLSQ